MGPRRFLIVVIVALGLVAVVATGWLWPDRPAGVLSTSLSLVWAVSGLVAAAILPLVAPRGRRALAAVLAVLVAAAVLYAPWREWTRGPSLSSAPAGSERLVLVSANVYHANGSPQALAKTLLASGADILLLQEAGGAARNALASLDALYPYRTACRSGCDLQIRSRLPIITGRRWVRLRALQDEGINAIWAQIAFGRGAPLTVVTTHFPQPVPTAKQQRFRHNLIDALRTVSDGTLIFSGDMNSSPWMKAMREQDRLLVPLVRWTRNLPTYPAQVTIGAVQIALPFSVLPIDHVYTGPAWHAASVSSFRLPGSDHRGVRLELWRMRHSG